jgi:hypothetical protein
MAEKQIFDATKFFGFVVWIDEEEARAMYPHRADKISKPEAEGLGEQPQETGELDTATATE